MLSRVSVDTGQVIPTYDPADLISSVEISEPTWEPRVLVVDDDEISRLAAIGLLQSLGFTVDAVAGGREALAASARWPYVAIFMDCEMPGIDGYAAARQLRAREGRNFHTPVIAMTSKPRWISLASGMDHHLAKPLEIDVLRADLQRLALLARGGAGPSGWVELLGRDTPLLDPSIFTETAADRTRPARAGLTFITQSVARLPELWRSINAEDRPSLQELAHTLRDGASTVGTGRVADLCDRLCQTHVNGATISAADIETQLRGVFSDTGAAIRAYVEGATSTESPTVRLAASPVLDIADPEPGERLRVAFADDDPLARIALSAMLGHADWLELVGAAAGVEEIVELASVKRPEVVVLDWMMPGGGGREAARRILARMPETLIVALTSSDSLEVLTEMTSAGASCVVAKGGSADQLTRTIARALTARAAARAAAADKRSNRRGVGGGMMLHSALSGESPLDEAGVQRLLSEFGTTGVLAELVELFGSQTPDRLSDMRRAVETGDATALRAGAHQLKGGCLTLAAVHMAKLCDELEATAGDNSLQGTAGLVERIESEFERTLAALSAITSAPNFRNDQDAG